MTILLSSHTHLLVATAGSKGVIPRQVAADQSDAEAVTRIADATAISQVRLFELGSFSCEVLDGHSATLLCVDVSPCGHYLAMCGKDKTTEALEFTQCCRGG